MWIQENYINLNSFIKLSKTSSNSWGYDVHETVETITNKVFYCLVYIKEIYIFVYQEDMRGIAGEQAN